MYVCVNCAKYKELLSQAAELVWGAKDWHSYCEAAREVPAHCLPTLFLWPFGDQISSLFQCPLTSLNGAYGLYCIPQSKSPWLPNATDNQDV